jgi:hypothetical protein
MIERWPSLDRGIATIARVEKKRTIGWEDAGYVVFSAGGTLCRRVDSLELLESDLAGMNSTYQFLGEKVDFMYGGQRMRYVPLGPVSTRYLSWKISRR